MTSCSSKHKPDRRISPAWIFYIIRTAFQNKFYRILSFLIIPVICMSYLSSIIKNFTRPFKNINTKNISIFFCLICFCNCQTWSCIILPFYSHRSVSKITHFYISRFDVLCIKFRCDSISINQCLLFCCYICKFKMININSCITHIRIIISIRSTVFILIFWRFCIPYFFFSNYWLNI